MATKWTLKQELIIIEEVSKSPEHLRDAFKRAADKINKTPHAVCTRYYSKINKPKIL